MDMEQRIRRLEQDINRLKAAYDQYFAGVERRPPDVLADKVAREVRTLTSTVMTNTALRFRTQQAISRYNTFYQYWQRKMRDQEEGREQRRRVTGSAVSTASKAKDPEVFEISASKGDKGEMDELFSALSQEYERLSSGKTLDRKKLRKALEQQTKTIREKYGSEKVAFKVVNEEGRVTIKAGPADRRKS